jgi:hypothetical protein
MAHTDAAVPEVTTSLGCLKAGRETPREVPAKEKGNAIRGCHVLI